MMKILPLIFAFALSLAAAPGQAQDVAAGEKFFKKCKSCHQIGPDARHLSGPSLNNVVGRVAGSAEGFKFKKDIVAAGKQGLVWDEETLSGYLTNPTKFLRAYLDNPKARAAMSFKVPKEEDRLNVIAFLATATAEAAPADASATPKVASAPELNVDEVIAAQSFDDAFIMDEANTSVGKEIWFAQCTHCHGAKAYPGKAPKLKPAKYTPEFVFKRVYKGFKKMPAWRESYSVDEIRQVVAYIKAPGFAP